MKYIQSEFYGDNVRWFIGVAKTKVPDPLRLGRVRVRVFGLHSNSISDIPNDHLPWATVALATNIPSNPSNYQAFGINDNDTVYGIFTDGEHSQQPLILGVIPTDKSYSIEWDDPQPSGGSSTTIVEQDSFGFSRDGAGYPIVSLAAITTSNGLSTQVAAEHQTTFQNFIDELESTGYVIKSLGGYNKRYIANTNVPSWHSYGISIDINPETNPVYYGPRDPSKTDMPPNTAAISQKYGLGWGDLWKGKKKDPMHFSLAANEGGTLNIDRVNYRPRTATISSESNNQEKAFNYLTQKFMDAGSKSPQIQAAAFVGNFMAESTTAVDPKAGPSYTSPIDGAFYEGANSNWGQEQSYGIAQWNRGIGRFQKLLSYAASVNKAPNILEVQLEFVMEELYNADQLYDGYLGSAAGTITIHTIKRKTDLLDATRHVMDSYETPQVTIDFYENKRGVEGEYRKQLDKRFGYAKSVYNKFTRGL